MRQINEGEGCFHPTEARSRCSWWWEKDEFSALGLSHIGEWKGVHETSYDVKYRIWESQKPLAQICGGENTTMGSRNKRLG